MILRTHIWLTFPVSQKELFYEKHVRLSAMQQTGDTPKQGRGRCRCNLTLPVQQFLFPIDSFYIAKMNYHKCQQHPTVLYDPDDETFL